MLPETSPVAHSRAQQHPFSCRILTFVLFAAGILGASLAFWMDRNVRTSQVQVATMMNVLRHDRAAGVPTVVVNPQIRRLTNIIHARVFAVLPVAYFSPLDGLAAQLQTFQRRASTLMVADQRREQHKAHAWGDKLVAAKGPWAAPLTAQATAQQTAHASLHRLLSLSREWESQYYAWEATLQHLSSIGGGLSDDQQPKRVLRALHQLQDRYVSRGEYWQGVSQAGSAIISAQVYLQQPPPKELSQYHRIVAVLSQASTHLSPPSHAELLHVLAGESEGLLHDQPRDVLNALNALNQKLAGAGPNWRGYPRAKAAVATADEYLNSPTLAQINHHQTIQVALQTAIHALTPPPPPVPAASGANPFGSALQQYLAHRNSQVSAAIYNANTGALYTLNPGVHFDTASIVKATIMATLLWQSRNAERPLTPEEQSLMVPMIDVSSNSAATSLWLDAGGAAGIRSFLQAAGMTQTQPGLHGYWGLTTTTALDQVRLLKLLAYPNHVLSPTSRSYALNLMQSVVASERWGVSTGSRSGSTVALKNGWLPLPSVGWEINSIGYLFGDGRNYVVALLSRDNPTEAYGIQTLDAVSQFIWKAE